MRGRGGCSPAGGLPVPVFSPTRPSRRGRGSRRLEACDALRLSSFGVLRPFSRARTATTAARDPSPSTARLRCRKGASSMVRGAAPRGTTAGRRAQRGPPAECPASTTVALRRRSAGWSTRAPTDRPMGALRRLPTRGATRASMPQRAGRRPAPTRRRAPTAASRRRSCRAAARPSRARRTRRR